MKVRVWTSWNTKKPADEGRPKCIYEGETQGVPNVGDYVLLREGFCAEKVVQVICDFVRYGEIEITVSTCDPENAYGECLFRKSSND